MASKDYFFFRDTDEVYHKLSDISTATIDQKIIHITKSDGTTVKCYEYAIAKYVRDHSVN